MASTVDNFGAVAIVVHGSPVAQGSLIRGGHGGVHAANDARLRPWRTSLADAAVAAMEGRDPWAGPVAVDLVFSIARPKGHWRTGARSTELRPSAPDVPTTKPDLDKLTRAVLDALTGIVFRDDSQVVDVQATKRYGTPGVRIWATTAE